MTKTMTGLTFEGGQRIIEVMVNDLRFQEIQVQWLDQEALKHGTTHENLMQAEEGSKDYELYYSLCQRFQEKTLAMACVIMLS